MKIVLSRPIPGNSAKILRDSGGELLELSAERDSAEFQTSLSTADGVLSLLSDDLSGEVLKKSPQLKVISNYAVGFNNIDLNICLEQGIVVTNTPEVLTDATADLAFTLLLMVARRIPESLKFLADGRFTGWKPGLLLGLDLKGKTLGILGMGRIGQAFASRAAAFGMRVVYFSGTGPKSSLPYSHLGFDQLLAESDFLSLHLPLTAQTRHLIDAKALRKMKRGAVLINTSRGPVVDEQALAAVLKDGHLFGAGLDVFEKEPEVFSGLFQCPNAVLLPHIGSATVETRSAMGEMAAHSLLCALKGERPKFTVNPEVFETPAYRRKNRR